MIVVEIIVVDFMGYYQVMPGVDRRLDVVTGQYPRHVSSWNVHQAKSLRSDYPGSPEVQSRRPATARSV